LLEELCEWRMRVPGSRPEVVDRRLSEFSDLLPDYRCYRHQLEAVLEFGEGRDVLLTAGLASGKTEAAVAALEHAGLKPAVFVYPTRALARDQYERLREYGFDVVVADSDHSWWRYSVGEDTDFILTNPEMVWRHYKHGYQLRRYLTSVVRAFVFDEVHFYKPNELNKVLAIVRTFRSRRFMFLSATVGNPEEFCRQVSEITGRECVHVRGSAFSSDRTFYACPRRLGDAVTAAAELAESEGRKVIVFFPSRNSAERWYFRLRRSFGDLVVLHHGALPRRDRARAEARFKSGEARVMLTVKTLQQGIDVGDCDTVVHTHLPPRVSDFHQREGRAGRREGVEAISILTSHELDKWTNVVLDSKERFRELYVEAGHEHLLASARSPLAKRIDRHEHPGFYSGSTVRLVDEEGNEVGTFGIQDVPYRLVPGCLMVRGSRVYVVSDLDLQARKARIEPADPRLAAAVRDGLWYRVLVTTRPSVGVGEIGVGKLSLVATEVVYEREGIEVDRKKAGVVVTLDALQAAVGHDDPELAEAGIHVIHYVLRAKGIPMDAFHHVVDESKVVVYEHPPATMHRILRELSEEDIKGVSRVSTYHPVCPWDGDVDVDDAVDAACRLAEKLSGLAEEFDERELESAGASASVRRKEPKRAVARLSERRFRSKENLGDDKKGGEDSTGDKPAEPELRCPVCGGRLVEKFHGGRKLLLCERCRYVGDDDAVRRIQEAVDRLRKAI